MDVEAGEDQSSNKEELCHDETSQALEEVSQQSRALSILGGFQDVSA